MTPEEARAWMAEFAVPFLRAAGRAILEFDGLEGDRGRLIVGTPAGAQAVDVPIFLPVEAMRANAEQVIRHALRQFEGECGRGFNNSGRGALEIGSRGYRSSDGWV